MAGTIRHMTVEYGGLEWVVFSVEYDPLEPADSLNPAHLDAVRWRSLELEPDVDLTPFLNDQTLNAIEDKLKEYFRNGG